MYINNPGHMTKMAALPIYCKNPSKILSVTLKTNNETAYSIDD